MEANKYRTSGVIDESTYREINKVLLSRRYIWFTRIAAVVTTIFTVLMVIVRSHFFTSSFSCFSPPCCSTGLSGCSSPI